MKLITFFLLAGLLTSCSIHTHWCLDINPESSPKIEDSFNLSYQEEDMDDNTWDIIDIPFSAENIG